MTLLLALFRRATSRTHPRNPATALVLLALVLSVALSGCSGDDDPETQPSDGASDGASPTATASAEPVKGITNAQAGQIKPRMPRARVIKLLGEPLLVQGPFADNTGGCIYYPIDEAPLANVWQFCFNDKGVNLVLTAFSSNQPSPPEDASPARAALIARADAVCQSQDGFLESITNDVSNALAAYSNEATAENLEKVKQQIGRFINNLKTTHDTLDAFERPEDNADVYDDYLDALARQIEALTQAKDAIAEQDFAAYDEHGVEFNEIGQEAITAVAKYGFSQCSAPTWG